MMFKRPRLRLACPLVNAVTAISLIFLAGCSQNEPQSGENTASEPNSSAQGIDSESLTLPVVWGTAPLGGAVADLAFTGGYEPVLAVAYRSGAFQLFDLNADALTQPVNLGTRAIATGQAVVLDGAALTLFPGIDDNGSIEIYAYNSVLGDPLELSLPITDSASGLCAGPPLDATSIMQIAYWSYNAPRTLVRGHVQEIHGELGWMEIERLQNITETPLATCLVGADVTVNQSIAEQTLIRLERNGKTETVAHMASGDITIRDQDGTRRPVQFRPGISVAFPSEPSAIAALSDVRFGGYPNGVIAIGGEVGPGDHRVVFIEPGPMFVNE